VSSYDFGVQTYQALAAGPAQAGGAGASMSAAAELFKAVAHPFRVKVLELLSQGESTIPELCEGTGVKPAHLSRHLTQMRGQGLIECVRSGGHLVYRLAYPEAIELLSAARSVLQARTAAAVSSLHPVPGEQPFPALWGDRFSAPEAALVSRSVIADACQSIASRTGCTPEAAVGRLITTARTCKLTLLEAALEELRDEQDQREA
jgi:DNA-binding transcriptional ArsR family regulator